MNARTAKLIRRYSVGRIGMAAGFYSDGMVSNRVSLRDFKREWNSLPASARATRRLQMQAEIKAHQ
jgi:hypothetical protein